MMRALIYVYIYNVLMNLKTAYSTLNTILVSDDDEKSGFVLFTRVCVFVCVFCVLSSKTRTSSTPHRLEDHHSTPPLDLVRNRTTRNASIDRQPRRSVPPTTSRLTSIRCSRTPTSVSRFPICGGRQTNTRSGFLRLFLCTPRTGRNPRTMFPTSRRVT